MEDYGDEADDKVEELGKPQVWNEQKDPLKEDEELEFANEAYQMLHRSFVEWPCLSIDVLVNDRISYPNTADSKAWFPSQMNGVLNPEESVFDKRLDINVHKKDKFPMEVYFCGGSQSENTQENKIYVMKWSDMHKTINDDEQISEHSGEDEEDLIEKMNAKIKQPNLRFESIPHKGAVNRIRSLHGSSIVATWSEENEVGIYNISSAINVLDKPPKEDEGVPYNPKKKKNKKNQPKKMHGGCKIAGFKHKSEGFALDWSPNTFGRLASGSCDAQLFVYTAADENCSSFVKETQVGLQSHKASIEDIQWSPSQEHVLATCSVDQTIKLWDLRATQQKCQVTWKAHDCDVNVISWNSHTKFLLASGDDKGEFKIWDMRMINPNE